MDTINQPVQSKAGKLSWSNMALKRCTSTEHLWNRKLVFLTSPVCSEIFLPRSHRSWRADVLSTPSVSMAIGSKIYRPLRSAYSSSLREAAISAAAPDSRAAALIYESASGHVTVTSQHSALPLDQGTSVRLLLLLLLLLLLYHNVIKCIIMYNIANCILQLQIVCLIIFHFDARY